MTVEPDRLSSKEHWDQRWESEGPQRIRFDPERPVFREIHALIQRNLPRDPAYRFLEVGSYPGTYMWYFHHYYGYQVSGLEYVEWCCERSRELLADVGVDADVIHADLFAYEPPADALWDVVGSFGFIEHFSDTAAVIERHLALVKPGGYLVLVIPNHHGINGRILRTVDPDKYETHNLMSYEDMERGVLDVGGADILEGGYLGRFGLWGTGLYARLARRPRYQYRAVRAPLWVAEHLGRLLPNTPYLSPSAALIARKR